MIGTFRHNSGDMKRPNNTHVTVATHTNHAAYYSSENQWSSVTAISCPQAEIFKPVAGYSGAGDSSDAARWHFYQQSGLAALKNNSQITPSALTVQVMNQNPLQTTSGLVYAAVTPLEANYGTHGGGQSGYDIGQNMVAFMKPRLLTLPKLALGGVCAHSHPLDMNDVSEFREIGDSTADGAAISPSSQYTWGLPHANGLDIATYGEAVDISTNGCAPIMFYRPDATDSSNGVADKLTFQVTTEYRVRFDLTNVASSTHKMHTPAPMTTYTTMMKRAVNALPGILENVTELAGAAGLTRGAAVALAA